MLHKSLYLILLSFSVCFQSLAQTVIWDEAVDGDLTTGCNCRSNTVFMDVNLVDGVNIIRGTVANASFNGAHKKADSFSFTVPNGASISDVVVSSLVFQNGNGSTSFDSYAGIPITYTAEKHVVSSGTSILSNWGGTALSPNKYGILISENTTEGSIYEVSITCNGCSQASIPTLSEWGLII